MSGSAGNILGTVALGAWLGAVASLPARTIVVDREGTGDHTAIQPALDAATDGDTVLVLPGEYLITESIDFNRPVDLDPGAAAKDLVLRSERGPGETTIRMSPDGGGSVMVFQHGESGDSLVEGFTLTGGHGSVWRNFTTSGGGLFFRNGSSPTIRNCIVTGNFVQGGGSHGGVAEGGGLCCVDSSPVLETCRIHENRAQAGPYYVGGSAAGGGLYLWNSSPHLIECAVERNVAIGGSGFGGGPAQGGGIACVGSSPRLTRSSIRGNLAQGGSGYGGGSGEGGGLYSLDSSPLVERCRIQGNTAAGGIGERSTGWAEGGGVHSAGSSVPNLVNCLVTGNSAAGGGGMSAAGESTPRLMNCTVTGNTARDSGGILAREVSTLSLVNCIVWQNRPRSLLAAESGAFHATYSCLEGEPAEPSLGNINSDPLFLVPGGFDDRGTPDDDTDDLWVEGDDHLQPGSPCIGAGTPEGTPVDDLEGHARLCGGGVDLGVYEWGGCPLPSGVLFLRGDATGDGRIDLSDAIGLLFALYAGQPTDCEDALDANDDGGLDTSDAIWILQYLYRGGRDLPEPFTRAGLDPTGDDGLGCRRR